MKGAALLEKQSGLIRAIIELSKHERLMLTELQWKAGLHPHVCNRAVQRLIDIGIITEDKQPPRRYLKLSSKGKEVAKALDDIDKILK